MSEWALRRFWQDATVTDAADGFAVLLDDRTVRTPAKTPLVVPTAALAGAIADEWRAQEETVDPRAMPFTRMANSALDKVAPQHAEVADMLAAYGDADLLCYRADGPAELVARQRAEWDPALDWAADSLGARLEPRTGIMHAPQSTAALQALSARVHALAPFPLAAFHDLVSLTGSLVLGLAAVHGWRDDSAIWALSRLDEDWQAEQWGRDEEAEELAAIKRDAFLHAGRFFRACSA